MNYLFKLDCRGRSGGGGSGGGVSEYGWLCTRLAVALVENVPKESVEMRTNLFFRS